MEFESPVDKNSMDDLDFKRLINEVKLQRIKDANNKLNSLNELENTLYEELYEAQERELMMRGRKKLQDLKNANRKFKI